MIIQGDNLDGLKALLPYYAGKVKCIYIDPPYNTSSFQNEHYDDNLERSVWLSKMYPRLDILYQLLSDDGLISIQIDDHNFAFLYLIASEIFGNKNLKTICVKMSESTGVKMASVNASGTIAKLKEHIILASKNGIKNLNVEKIPKEKWDQEYKTVLLGCAKEELEFVKNLSESAENNEEIIPEDIEKANNILLKAEFANVKDVCKKETGKSLYDEWLFSNAWRIIQVATLTGGAKKQAFDFNQSWVPEEYISSSKVLPSVIFSFKNPVNFSEEKVKELVKKIKEENPDYQGDLGFKVFKLDSSNIKRWDANFDNLKQNLIDAVDYIKQDRSNDDIVYEILLKYGLDLAVPIEIREIAGAKIYIIGLGALVICLDKNITMEVVNGICTLKTELSPEIMRVVFSDNGFRDDVIKTNAIATLKRAGIEDIKSL